ncbi:MAG: CHASE2 domain-containing protein, partial [Tepidisphaeraceae bacterium]
TYFLGKSARKLTSRHVIITTLVAAAVGVIIAGQIGEWVKQTGLDERYAARLTAWSGASMTGPLRSVTMVLLTPQTDVVELAQRLGVAGVRAGDILTTRALHTALLQKLASAGPRVVAFDIRFRRETPFDQEFAQAARALKESGADVIAVLPAWDTQTDSAPPISPLLAEVFKAGPATFAFEPSLVMYLAVRRLGAESMMSMALLAVSAYWEPGAVPSAEIFSSGLGSGASQVIVRFTREKGGVQTAPAHRIVPISCGIEWHEAPSPNGLKPGDFVGCYYIQIPPDSRLSASQVEYSKVFSASADELRQWFGGKVVLIGDLRPEAGDVVFTLPDGRKLYGVSANALAIDALLDGTAIVTDSTVSIGGWGIGTRVLFATVAGLAGALVGAAFWTSAIRRLSVVALLIMLVIVASLLMYRAAQMLIPPTWSVLSVIATSELSAALARVRRPNV